MADMRMLHLTPRAVWARQSQGDYVPEAYERDGFTHCTYGAPRLIEVANLFYTADVREMVVLVIDPSLLESPVKIEDPDGAFPHVHGPINANAVTDVLPVARGVDGRFVSIGNDVA